jgi:hypothetical protein
MRFRITQKTTTSFHIQLVRNDRYSAGGEERIRKNWSQLLRSAVTVTFEYLPELPVERSGKFRHVVSEVTAAPQPQA